MARNDRATECRYPFFGAERPSAWRIAIRKALSDLEVFWSAPRCWVSNKEIARTSHDRRAALGSAR